MILFDGCSYTYGYELENPEKDAFPHLVARMGLMEGASPRNYESIAYNGKSNDAILRTTIEFCENNPVSLAVIQFSNFCRRELLLDRYFNITPQNKDDISLAYYETLSNKHDDVSNYHKNKFLLEQYFKKKNIRYFFLNLQKMKEVSAFSPSSWYFLQDPKPPINVRDIIGSMKNNPENFVGNHPSKLGHSLIARYLHAHIY